MQLKEHTEKTETAIATALISHSQAWQLSVLGSASAAVICLKLSDPNGLFGSFSWCYTPKTKDRRYATYPGTEQNKLTKLRLQIILTLKYVTG